MLLVNLLLVISLGLIFLLTLVSYFISESTPLSREESSTYECGFEHHSYSRLPFSIRYFMLTLVFLIFDIEVMFLLFIPASFFTTISISMFVILFCFFIVILLLGLIYEWIDGSLDWVLYSSSLSVEHQFFTLSVGFSSVFWTNTISNNIVILPLITNINDLFFNYLVLFISYLLFVLVHSPCLRVLSSG